LVVSDALLTPLVRLKSRPKTSGYGHSETNPVNDYKKVRCYLSIKFQIKEKDALSPTKLQLIVTLAGFTHPGNRSKKEKKSYSRIKIQHYRSTV
jgi:hypothetical protein